MNARTPKTTDKEKARVINAELRIRSEMDRIAAVETEFAARALTLDHQRVKLHLRHAGAPENTVQHLAGLVAHYAVAQAVAERQLAGLALSNPKLWDFIEETKRRVAAGFAPMQAPQSAPAEAPPSAPAPVKQEPLIVVASR